MKITFINGTNRVGNKTLLLTKELAQLRLLESEDVSIVDMNNFDVLFRGEYISRENSNEHQLKDIQKIAEANLVVFVVPVYHHSIPTALKNFIDTVKDSEIYNNTTIAFVSNNKSSVEGAYQAEDAMKGIIAFDKLHSQIVSRIEKLTVDGFDELRAEAFLDYCMQLAVKLK